VVDLVKKHKKAVTLAIGDGANDVGMIKGEDLCLLTTVLTSYSQLLMLEWESVAVRDSRLYCLVTTHLDNSGQIL